MLMIRPRRAFIIGLVATAADAVATEAQTTEAQTAINAIVAALPAELGGMIVAFLTGAAGLMTAVGGLF